MRKSRKVNQRVKDVETIRVVRAELKALGFTATESTIVDTVKRARSRHRWSRANASLGGKRRPVVEFTASDIVDAIVCQVQGGARV